MNEHERRQSFRRQALLVIAAFVLLLGALNFASEYLLKAALRSGARRLIEMALLFPCYHRAEIVLDALDSADPIAELDAVGAAKLIIREGLSAENREKLRAKLKWKAESAVLEETRHVARELIQILDGIAKH